MTEPREMVTVTAPDGSEVEVPSNLIFGEAGEEAPIPFAINGELFWATSAVPAEDLGQLTALLANMPKPEKGKDAEVTPDQTQMMIESVMKMMELFLIEESAERLAARLSDKQRPISVPRLLKIVTTFLNEQYAESESDEERPTKPTSD